MSPPQELAYNAAHSVAFKQGTHTVISSLFITSLIPHQYHKGENHFTNVTWPAASCGKITSFECTICDQHQVSHSNIHTQMYLVSIWWVRQTKPLNHLHTYSNRSVIQIYTNRDIIASEKVIMISQTLSTDGFSLTSLFEQAFVFYLSEINLHSSHSYDSHAPAKRCIRMWQ